MSVILMNGILLCLDSESNTPEMDALITSGNNWFLVYFTFEMLFKILGVGPNMYWYDNWNKFDSTIVIISLIALHP